MLPWQACTIGSGLMLHAPLDITPDIAALRTEFAVLDANLGAEHRTCYGGDGSWTAVSLMERPLPDQPQATNGSPTPALSMMPSVRAFLEGFHCAVLSCHISRQAPGGALPWHFDNQALHLTECRILVPLRIPPGAKTHIGHETAAYPEGTVWTGDFSFPHMVENPTSDQRIVLLIDILSNDWARGRAPAALSDDATRRARLSGKAQSEWVHWPGRQAAYA